jgi:pimeloyl-ACP methyl ester carboxylesterase
MATSEQVMTAIVTSKDGTPIAYECAGTGPALILVDAAGHYREFSSFTGLIDLLIRDFTVYHYDRRGRGDSGDTGPYAVEREVDDLDALIVDAGGSAFLYAFSSGGLVALHAAASRLPIEKLAMLEPPIEVDEDRSAQRAFTARLTELVGAGDRDAAVNFYLTGIGVPDEIVGEMRGTTAWSALAAVAHTLVYDSLVSEATSFRLLASVPVPTLVLDSEGSGDDLASMAATVANGMPHASHLSLPGEWHGIPDEILAPALVEFFKGS